MKRITMCVAALLVAATAAAGPGPIPGPEGSFERLAPADQEVARAIFEAQKPSAPKALSLDQLAHRKLYDRKGWPSIYRDLQRQGLVREKSLDQALKSAARRASSGESRQ
jgi:hypothetical protein